METCLPDNSTLFIERKRGRKYNSTSTKKRFNLNDEQRIYNAIKGIDGGSARRKICRIIEKRVCQKYWKRRHGDSAANRFIIDRSISRYTSTHTPHDIKRETPRNYKYCISCKKSKILFETKKKADNFIKFNSQEILEENGKAPVRSYYCEFCGGWHVTSNPSIMTAEYLDRKDRAMMKTIEEEINQKKIKTLINNNLAKVDQQLNKSRKLFNSNEFEKAEKMIVECEMEIEYIKFKFNLPSSHTKLQTIIDKARRVREEISYNYE